MIEPVALFVIVLKEWNQLSQKGNITQANFGSTGGKTYIWVLIGKLAIRNLWLILLHWLNLCPVALAIGIVVLVISQL